MEEIEAQVIWSRVRKEVSNRKQKDKEAENMKRDANGKNAEEGEKEASGLPTEEEAKKRVPWWPKWGPT